MRRPRLSVRFRLTSLYGVLFLVSGALLLTIAGGVTVSRTSVSASSANQPAGSALRHAEVQLHQLRARLAASAHSQSAISHQLIISSFIALGVMTVLSVGLGWLVAGRALRPVREMTASARRISEDSLNERLSVTGPADELRELGDTIDGLLERLETAFTAQRRFVANASHELRTPLATIRACLDVALAKPEPAPPQTVALAARLRAELDRIDALLEAFLVLARAQHADLPGRCALPLDYIVTAALAKQAVAIEVKRLTVRNVSDPGGAWVFGSEALLTRMVENVIENAVRHNHDGGWISIATSTSGGRCAIVVENSGQALDQRQAAELVLPFRRFGADRTGSDQSCGLGLSIVAAIAQVHAGTLDLRARTGGGLRVGIDLPAAIAADLATS